MSVQNEDVRNYFYGNKSKVGCCVCNMIWSLVFSRVCFLEEHNTCGVAVVILVVCLFNVFLRLLVMLV